MWIAIISNCALQAHGRQYEKKLTSIATSPSRGIVTASFADGSSVTGKCLIGSDGSRSTVRSIVVNDEKLSEPFDAGCTIINFPYSYSADVSRSLRDIHPVTKVGYHPKMNNMYLLASQSFLSAFHSTYA
jgi:2-polyprenyl-6-methoxyphenol hydroxylase-like FAD-dependent oxidoreductase